MLDDLQFYLPLKNSLKQKRENAPKSRRLSRRFWLNFVICIAFAQLR